MVFKVQPSNKGRKKRIGRRMKQGSSFAAHQEALAAIQANEDGEVDPADDDTGDDDTGDILPPVVSTKQRKDDSWRSNRAVKSAKRAAAKALAKRDLAIEDHVTIKQRLDQASAHVLRVQHEQYVEKKASRVISLKTEEDHRLAISVLHDKHHGDLQVAHEEVGAEIAKRLLEEGRRIEAAEKHARDLRNERVHYSTKIEKEQAKLQKERRGQALQVDHLHKQWIQRLAESTLKFNKEKAECEAKLALDMERTSAKLQKEHSTEKEKLLNKLAKKDHKLESAKDERQKR